MEQVTGVLVLVAAQHLLTAGGLDAEGRCSPVPLDRPRCERPKDHTAARSGACSPALLAHQRFPAKVARSSPLALCGGTRLIGGIERRQLELSARRDVLRARRYAPQRPVDRAMLPIRIHACSERPKFV